MLKKKRVLFPLMFFSHLAVFVAIALIFNLETHNSVLGVIYAYTMGFMVIGFLIKILKDHKKQILDADVFLWSEHVIMLFYVAIAVIIINMIYMAIAIAVGIIEIT